MNGKHCACLSNNKQMKAQNNTSKCFCTTIYYISHADKFLIHSIHSIHSNPTTTLLHTQTHTDRDRDIYHMDIADQTGLFSHGQTASNFKTSIKPIFKHKELFSYLLKHNARSAKGNHYINIFLLDHHVTSKHTHKLASIQTNPFTNYTDTHMYE